MVSGLTITRNAMRSGYPLVEVILAGIDLCEEFVVMDDSDDDTPDVLERMRRRYGKIRVIRAKWPLREEGPAALATVTNWGMDSCRYPWLLYLQADEVLHESVVWRLQQIVATNEAPAVQVHRLQLEKNFQSAMGAPRDEQGRVTGLPDGHWVVRLGRRDHLVSAGDALSFAVKDDRYLTLDPDPGHFQLFDITRCFAWHFPHKAEGQRQIWWREANENAAGWYGRTPSQWRQIVDGWEENGYPALWTRRTSPFMGLLPHSMQRWVGATKYYALPELVD